MFTVTAWLDDTFVVVVGGTPLPATFPSRDAAQAVASALNAKMGPARTPEVALAPLSVPYSPPLERRKRSRGSG